MGGLQVTITFPCLKPKSPFESKLSLIQSEEEKVSDISKSPVFSPIGPQIQLNKKNNMTPPIVNN